MFVAAYQMAEAYRSYKNQDVPQIISKVHHPDFDLDVVAGMSIDITRKHERTFRLGLFIMVHMTLAPFPSWSIPARKHDVPFMSTKSHKPTIPDRHPRYQSISARNGIPYTAYTFLEGLQTLL